MRKFEIVEKWALKYNNDNITLPKRATANSAGYDFYSPVDALIEPHTKELIYTNVKALMNEGECLLIFARSGLAKKGISLANGVGLIDKDHYGNEENDGNIAVLLENNTNTPYEVKIGDKIAQGVFMPFLIADEEDTSNFQIRKGLGFGSTGR